ncbi:hypothetical protein QWZ06_16795 [Chryseobacterium tructae]|uniref:Uncharacterized protein n=1 Tax=Chryseobacterium tructae TaxID=1037380 RepID=A0ABV7XZ07_9FLAO|nr:hypothetical protein [Chryseobacterium tructae]MDN3693831.1 hypothetical protein [Chryseobacterium tructae]
MKFNSLLFMLIFIGSCAVKDNIDIDSDFRKYELAYNSITNKMNLEKPFLKEYNSDASGVKIIPKVFKIKNYSIYRSENFKNENSFSNEVIKKLSEKYTQPNWRKDKRYKVVKLEELKDFYGPLQYIYFSEIKNDSLRADVLGNPFAQYSMTTGVHYLIIFENNQVKSVQKNVGHYD